MATITLGLTTAACGGSDHDGGGSSFNAALTSVVNPSTAKGGTLNLWSSLDADSWDPARGYLAWVWNMQRLLTRKLLEYAAAPGTGGLTLVPDLASAQPLISDDKLTYTFTLRDGLKWDDGAPITSKDIKYGIERIFATKLITGGPYFLPRVLDQGQNYSGPYRDADPDKLGLNSVRTPDDKTIVFHLRKPDSVFLNLLAMPAAGPVPRKRDTGVRYGLSPASSGPYLIKDIRPDKSASLVRNPHWDPATDPIRKALPDAINLTITSNANDLDSRLLAGAVDLDAGQTGVQPAARSKLLSDPALKAHADAVPTGFLPFAALVTTVAPMDDIDCRKAVIYAADPTSIQAALGGQLGGGDIGTSMLPPNIPGAEPAYDPFHRRQGKPQLDEAKQALRACGRPDGFDTTIAVGNSRAADVKAAEALQAALKAVNINAKIAQYDGARDAAIAGSPEIVRQKGFGIIVTGWAADYPSGSGFLQPLADSNFIRTNGNYNRPEIKDPAIDRLFIRAAGEADPADLFRQINHRVMEGAYFLPFTVERVLNYRSPRLTNVYVHEAFGQVDIQALGVTR